MNIKAREEEGKEGEREGGKDGEREREECTIFIRSFNKYLLSTYHVPDFWGIIVNKVNKVTVLGTVVA